MAAAPKTPEAVTLPSPLSTKSAASGTTASWGAGRRGRGGAAGRVEHSVLCCKGQQSAWAGLLLSTRALQVGACCRAGGTGGSCCSPTEVEMAGSPSSIDAWMAPGAASVTLSVQHTFPCRQTEQRQQPGRRRACRPGGGQRQRQLQTAGVVPSANAHRMLIQGDDGGGGAILAIGIGAIVPVAGRGRGGSWNEGAVEGLPQRRTPALVRTSLVQLVSGAAEAA